MDKISYESLHSSFPGRFNRPSELENGFELVFFPVVVLIALFFLFVVIWCDDFDQTKEKKKIEKSGDKIPAKNLNFEIDVLGFNEQVSML
jgi:hypothetical protein